MNIDLDPDGPHSGDYSREVARAVAEGARVLNHASIGPAPGLEYASDVDSIAGSVQAAVAGLPQLLTQLAGFLVGLQQDGRLGDDAGADPQTRLASAAYHLGGARQQAADLADTLTKVQASTSHMQTLDITDDHA